MGIHVRIDEIEGLDVVIFTRDLMDYASPRRSITAKEGRPNNPHVHYYLDTDRSDADIRNWITRKYKVLTKDKKCVKKWGDEDKDMRYYCKGNKTGIWKGVDIDYTGFTYDQIVKFNKEYYEHPSQLKQKTNLTAWLTEICRSKGITDELGIIEEFIEQRAGKDGICAYKHGHILKSVYLALNGKGEKLSEALRIREKVFGF